VTVFALMDEWIAGVGDSGDAWLGLGLRVLDGWQGSARPDDATTGQQHLASTLLWVRAQRSVALVPDPVALALWFHHCGRLDPSLLDRLAEVGGPALGLRVRRLVEQLAGAEDPSGDPAACLVHAAHRASLSVTHLTPVRARPADQ
jgi:hypothetical protein